MLPPIDDELDSKEPTLIVYSILSPVNFISSSTITFIVISLIKVIEDSLFFLIC